MQTPFLTSVLESNLYSEEIKKEVTAILSLAGKLGNTIDSYAELRKEWEQHYKAQYGWDVDFSKAVVPPVPQDGRNYRALFIAKGLTPNKVYDAWTFPKKKWGDLDNLAYFNRRLSDEHYVVWVLIENELDQEFLGKSVKQSDLNMNIGITLLERMVWESKYFSETGKRLVVKGEASCSGSRSFCADVPHVTTVMSSDEVCVFVYFRSSTYSNPYESIRRVVS